MKNIVQLLTIAGVSVVMLGSCASQKAQISDLSGRWDITAIDSKAITLHEDARQPYLGFDVVNGRLHGSAGCNNIMATFATNEPAGVLRLGPVASTRMMCPDAQTENSVLNVLNNVTGFRKSGRNEVILSTATSRDALPLRRAEPETSAAQLEGKWRIVELNGTEVKATPEQPVTISFLPQDKTFSCETGCNLLGGTYTSNYTDFTFAPGMQTMMACPDTTTEESLKLLLPTVKTFGRTADGNYAFYNGNNGVVMVIAR